MFGKVSKVTLFTLLFAPSLLSKVSHFALRERNKSNQSIKSRSLIHKQPAASRVCCFMWLVSGCALPVFASIDQLKAQEAGGFNHTIEG